MVKERKKPDITGNALLACVIAAILIICIQAAGTYLSLQSFMKCETSYPSIESGLKGSIEQLSFSIDSQSEKDKKAALADTYFRALYLRDKMSRSDFLDSTVEDYGKSYVVRVKDGKLAVSDDAERLPEITADALKGEQGIIDTSRDSDWRCFTAYSSIGNGYYALQEVNASDGSDNLASIALYEIETAFDGKAILLDENGRFVYYNNDLEIPDLRNENGLDEAALNKYLEKHAPYYVMARSADERYTLIFEKAFQVGDIVEIDGVVRGTVQELGVRTLKLFGDDNNLKVVRYSDVHKINNLSRSNSWCVAEFTVKNNVDTEELKKLLWTELPEIRARHPEILSDPVFTGISSINTGSITFGVRAECKESKMRKVRSILNYEIRDMLNRNEVGMI